MQNKLYYHDPYLTSFTATVVKQQQEEDGRIYAVLSATAFYPTGGGQPHDTGTINGVKVIGVEEIDGEIRHYLDSQLSETEGKATGEINWKRRFDHMQQHAGQHILSAAFERLLGCQTISFHLGKETLTIDLDIEELAVEDAEKVEKLANEIILENRPIETKWVTAGQLSAYPLRKQPSVTENIRLVIIPDFDYNGCGGTHPRATGQVASIKLLDWERQKKKVRVQFVCGSRVLEQLDRKHRILRELGPLLNSPEQDMPGVLEQLLHSKKETEKSLEAAQDRLLQFEARELLGTDEKLVGKVFNNRTVQELQNLARLVTAGADDVTVYFVSEMDGRLQFVCARGKAAPGSMKKLVGQVLPLINGKGGGNDSFAQGGGATVMDGQQFLKQILSQHEQLTTV
ncbi:alanyl-tRNA editing protein [Bacillus sp. T33-2]|uniref:alanyl-tRNA editing protein n=1 Tax=Bacillus sp. T33-2 TaxID=2054168 RepID=UPI000C791452|nr:DHHA1 domain-containing protein [Bacillus sp. T33-2]PLR95233.1 alanyl-tRNA editing protein [Bacillus sp. T33-2]